MKSITFHCDDDIKTAIEQEAIENFEGNISLQIRAILRDWYKEQNQQGQESSSNIDSSQ